LNILARLLEPTNTIRGWFTISFLSGIGLGELVQIQVEATAMKSIGTLYSDIDTLGVGVVIDNEDLQSILDSPRIYGSVSARGNFASWSHISPVHR